MAELKSFVKPHKTKQDCAMSLERKDIIQKYLLWKIDHHYYLMMLAVMKLATATSSQTTTMMIFTLQMNQDLEYHHYTP